MLMRTCDCRIDRHRPVDLPGRVGLGKDLRQHPIPRPVTGVTAMPLPHRLPRAELLAGQVTPRDPGAEPVRDALHNPPVVTERVTTPPGIGRQRRSDPLPLRIRKHPISRTRRPHPTRLPRTSRYIWETRPSAELDKRCASAGLMRGKTLKTDFPFGRYEEAKAAALQLGKVKSGQAGPNPSTAMPNFLDAIRALAD